MRPRSRLLSKRCLLLPTIREGTEETLRDRNEANALHVSPHSAPISSEDYLLSICHLAHPTFPCRDVTPDNTQQSEATHQRRRLSRHGGKTTSRCPAEEDGDDRELSSIEMMFGNSDPLELLYGHHSQLSGGVRRAFGERRFMSQARSRAYSIPRASSPVLPRNRKSSCPELHNAADAADRDVSPKHGSSRSEVQARSQEVMGAEVERQLTPVVKHSLISQWISDCRSAWREARVRVCMLPAIAEM